MNLRQSWTPALVVAVIALATGGWLLQESGAGSSSDAYARSRMFQQVHHLVSERYVEEVPGDSLYRMAIEGMLRELGDPHTVFLDSAEYAELQLNTTGNYGGLGIRITAQDEWITVVGVLPNTPAEQAGLQVGDRIVQVEGKSARGWSTTDAVKVLRGPKGSAVEITVARVGVDKPLRFSITRDEVHVVSVYSFMLDDAVGYVRLQQFSRQARDELRGAIDSLRQEGARALVLDLSSNTGGLLDEGVGVADLFLDEGVEVVSTRGRVEALNESYRAPGAEVYPGLPVAVLVSGYSASASEIVAGALQDRDRAIIVGTRTFGKGSVQSLFKLPGRNFLKMTTARWYTPSGRSIQKDRDPESEMSEMMAQAVSVNGNPVSATAVSLDSTERQVYRTDSGREVYGGGGITPDLIVLPDTLTTREQVLRSALSKSGVLLADAAFKFAVNWAERHPDLSPDFRVTDEMVDAFYRHLTSREDVELDRGLYRDSRRWIDWQLRRQVANAAFGETARIREEVRTDTQVRRAAELLRKAASTEELIALAEAAADAGEEESPGDGGE